MNDIICHDFILGPVDTDSISFCNSDYSEFTEEQQKFLLDEINSLLPDLIRYEHDGFFRKIIILKAKNYILYDGKKIKLKGSSLKSSKMEKALKEFQQEVITNIVHSDVLNIKEIQAIYHKYIKEAMNITDILRWSSRKTISEKVLSSERTNESKIRDALTNEEYQEGDKLMFFFGEDDKLVLAKNWNMVYSHDRMIEKLYKTSQAFSGILPKETFINYKLKKNRALLEEILK